MYNLLAGRVLRELFLPAPLNAAYTVFRSIKFLWKGVCCLWRRKLEVEVNGKKTILKDLQTDDSKGMAIITLPVELKAGNNVIRMCSPYCWAPDIDCFTLEKDI